MIRYRLFALFVVAFVCAAAPAGTILVTHTGDSGTGSLRAAIEATNDGTCSSPCSIVFNIAGSPEPGGVFTITPLTGLPTLDTNNVAIIDGATQTAFGGDTNPFGPEIVLSGTNACFSQINCRGFRIENASIVRNLVINGWSFRPQPDVGHGAGINLAFIHNQVPTFGVEVSSNYLGTDPTGMMAVPNDDGIRMSVVGATIADNVISGNYDFGIFGLRGMLFAPLENNSILGNLIGTTRNGNAPLPNGTGIQFMGSVNPTGNAIGSLAPGGGNTIAYNLEYGIRFFTGAGCGNTIRGNSIHSNGALGIADTGATYPGLNPECGVDRFPPQLETLSYDAPSGQTTVTGGFWGHANLPLTLDFYTNSQPDPSGFGEGETYLATRNITTDGQGKWSVQLPGDLRGSNLVATTTESSFSNVIGSKADLRLTKTEAHSEPVAPRTRLRYTLAVENLGPDAATNVLVIDSLPPGIDNIAAIAGPEWSCVNNGVAEIRCTLLQDLAAGATASFVIEGDVNVADTTITNTATVTLTEEDTNPANNTASKSTVVRGFLADLFIEHQVKPDVAEVGSLVPYELRIVNLGPDEDPAVTVTITLSPEQFVESLFLVDGAINCTGSNPMTCAIGAIPSGEQRVVLLGLRAPLTGSSMWNTVTVDGLRNDPVASNDTSFAETRLTQKKGKRRAARH